MIGFSFCNTNLGAAVGLYWISFCFGVEYTRARRQGKTRCRKSEAGAVFSFDGRECLDCLMPRRVAERSGLTRLALSRLRFRN